MATTTTNLGLIKPATTDNVDITVLNGNMDSIDSAVSTNLGYQKSGWIPLTGTAISYISTTSFSINVDYSALVDKDTTIQLYNNSTAKYYQVTNVSVTSNVTTFTIQAINGSANLVSGAITNVYYSPKKAFGLIGSNVMTAYLTSNLTLTGTSPTKLTLSNYNTVGSKLSISNGGILIGSGVSNIKVSGQAVIAAIVADGKRIYLYKESAVITSIPGNGTANQEVGMSISPITIPVTSGNVIYLYAKGANTDVVYSNASYIGCTYLTVEVIN